MFFLTWYRYSGQLLIVEVCNTVQKNAWQINQTNFQINQGESPKALICLVNAS